MTLTSRGTFTGLRSRLPDPECGGSSHSVRGGTESAPLMRVTVASEGKATASTGAGGLPGAPATSVHAKEKGSCLPGRWVTPGGVSCTPVNHEGPQTPRGARPHRLSKASLRTPREEFRRADS